VTAPEDPKQLDHCEVSISALVEVRSGGRSSDFYSTYQVGQTNSFHCISLNAKL
jgi:hypothetical protein